VAEGTRLLSEYGVSSPIEGSNPSLSVLGRPCPRSGYSGPGASLPIKTGMPVSFSIADSSDGPRKVVIWVTGDLDADTGRAVRGRLVQAQRHLPADVILDLAGVQFVDTGGLTSILIGARSLSDVGRLRVISPPEQVAKIFTEAGLANLFELTPDRRGRKEDRRRRQVPVAIDRRKGERRRLGDGASDSVDEVAAEPVQNPA
jgi:anti-sigma B factor antagonist